jgi:hypothetical protein
MDEDEPFTARLLNSGMSLLTSPSSVVHYTSTQTRTDI